jgi:hypothetical protein
MKNKYFAVIIYSAIIVYLKLINLITCESVQYDHNY